MSVRGAREGLGVKVGVCISWVAVVVGEVSAVLGVKITVPFDITSCCVGLRDGVGVADSRVMVKTIGVGDGSRVSTCEDDNTRVDVNDCFIVAVAAKFCTERVNDAVGAVLFGKGVVAGINVTECLTGIVDFASCFDGDDGEVEEAIALTRNVATDLTVTVIVASDGWVAWIGDAHLQAIDKTISNATTLIALIDRSLYKLPRLCQLSKIIIWAEWKTLIACSI